MERTMFFVLLLLFFSCQLIETEESKPKSNSASNKDAPLQVKDPRQLDLTKDQLFIDTTRNSIFYKKMKAWKPDKFLQKITEDYLKATRSQFKRVEVELDDFPAEWIFLQKLAGRYVIHDRCDGNVRRFKIEKDAVVFYGVHESEVYSIRKVLKFDKESLSIELQAPWMNKEEHIFTLSLWRMADGNVFCSRENAKTCLGGLCTPVENIDHFDLLVDNCVTQKRVEFKAFDKE